MALRIKVVGSGSTMPKLLGSVNHPDDFSVPGWKVAKDWVAPCVPNEETGEGDVNFASVAAGYPVWDGSRLHSEQGTMSLQEFFEHNNIPEGDQIYFRGELESAWEQAMNGEPQPDRAYVNCRPLWNARCVCVRRGQPLRLKNGKTLHLRVRPSFYAVGVTIPDIPPTIEAEVVLTETKHDYSNLISTYAERPSLRGSNEDGELVEIVEGQIYNGSPWPEDKHRAVVLGTMMPRPEYPDSAENWTNYILPTDEDGEKGVKFAGTVVKPWPEGSANAIDEDYLESLDNIQTNLNDIASHDPTGGKLIPAPTVGNPWRVGLYYKAGKLVMARGGETYGQGVSYDTQVPYSRLLRLKGFPLSRQYWPETSYPPAQYPDARVTYPSKGGETKTATLASNSALDTYAYFFESIGNSDISQMPWREMRCTVKSGNGRASSSASVACVAFYAGSYWGNLDLKINGAAPRDGVTVETIGNIVAVSVPLDKYWSRSSTNTWQSDQTLNIIARWRGHDTFFPLVNAAFNDVPLPSVPDPASVDFDEFRQWDFGWPSQN